MSQSKCAYVFQALALVDLAVELRRVPLRRCVSALTLYYSRVASGSLLLAHDTQEM
jgi:hypothetical protein